MNLPNRNGGSSPPCFLQHFKGRHHPWRVIALLIAVIATAVAAGSYLYYRSQEEGAIDHAMKIQKARASLQRQFNDLNSQIDEATKKRSALKDSIDRFNETYNTAADASQQRGKEPDVQAQLNDAQAELDAVNSLQSEIDDIETRCADLVDTLIVSFGESRIEDLKHDCSEGVNSWRKSQADWWRAVKAINTALQDRLNGAYWDMPPDVSYYYQASTEAYDQGLTAIDEATAEGARLTQEMSRNLSAKAAEMSALR